MHPAASIIAFTVASGAGFGLIAALGLPAAWGAAPTGALFWWGFVVAFALAIGGLLASTLHLGHPERAVRAFSQWRTSWLSREGVLAVATLAVAGAYALSILGGLPVARILGPVAAVLSLVTVFATSMIYAQLRTVDRWHTPLTPVAFLGFALGSGVTIAAALHAATGEARLWPIAALVFTAIGWIARRRAWNAGDRRAPTSTPETATGLGHLGRVRLFEAPHTGPNYLLKEMGFVVARRHAEKLRILAAGVGGFVPMILDIVAWAGVAPALLLSLSAILLLAGLVVERWLFFAEARHAQMAFYDRSHT
ncbi:dimethyl sulfoxide reductase anchor subunit [Rhodobacterales bacterium HKCCE2091]|nr:dimethyl sulfoxide reductase anchor subunit [Rhodobacterales bacterium HKCCE2091]